MQTTAHEEELVKPTNTKFSSGSLCWKKGNEDSAFLSFDLEKV
jgi:hypothetical protein